VKFTGQRYQYGSLTKETRKAGPAVWIFGWRENTRDGRVNRKVVVGTAKQFPTKTSVCKAAEPLHDKAIADNSAVPVTVQQLVKHYKDNELPSKAYSSQRTVETYLRVWVLPLWGEYRLSDVRTVEVESWLHSLTLANATKAKIRNVMHCIFDTLAVTNCCKRIPSAWCGRARSGRRRLTFCMPKNCRSFSLSSRTLPECWSS